MLLQSFLLLNGSSWKCNCHFLPLQGLRAWLHCKLRHFYNIRSHSCTGLIWLVQIAIEVKISFRKVYTELPRAIRKQPCIFLLLKFVFFTVTKGIKTSTDVILFCSLHSHTKAGIHNLSLSTMIHFSYSASIYLPSFLNVHQISARSNSRFNVLALASCFLMPFFLGNYGLCSITQPNCKCNSNMAFGGSSGPKGPNRPTCWRKMVSKTKLLSPE